MEPKARTESLIAEGTSCQGVVISEGPLTVSGTIDGELTAPEAVVTATGCLHGKIQVERLTCEGEVSGDVEADTLKLSGRVGDQTRIRAQSLEVKLAGTANDPLQVSFGAATLEVGPEPALDDGSAGVSDGDDDEG